MKTKIIMMTALLALLATGCENIDATRVRLFAEDMTAVNGTKVWVDPADVSNTAVWIVGENIDINGTEKTIEMEGTDYVITNVSTASMRYAVYPATTNSNNNVVTVTDNGTSDVNIAIESLNVNFTNGGHEIIFPMAAQAATTEDALLFSHLTAGLKINLKAETADQDIVAVRVIVYGDGPADAVQVNGVNYTTEWSFGQPTQLPIGETGTIEDRSVMYASDMLFYMQTDGTDGVEVSTSNTEGVTFCVPVSIANAERISVICYNASYEPVCSKTHELGNVAIERNHLYPIPTIKIN